MWCDFGSGVENSIKRLKPFFLFLYQDIFWVLFHLFALPFGSAGGQKRLQMQETEIFHSWKVFQAQQQPLWFHCTRWMRTQIHTIYRLAPLPAPIFFCFEASKTLVCHLCCNHAQFLTKQQNHSEVDVSFWGTILSFCTCPFVLPFWGLFCVKCRLFWFDCTMDVHPMGTVWQRETHGTNFISDVPKLLFGTKT